MRAFLGAGGLLKICRYRIRWYSKDKTFLPPKELYEKAKKTIEAKARKLTHSARLRPSDGKKPETPALEILCRALASSSSGKSKEPLSRGSQAQQPTSSSEPLIAHETLKQEPQGQLQTQGKLIIEKSGTPELFNCKTCHDNSEAFEDREVSDLKLVNCKISGGDGSILKTETSAELSQKPTVSAASPKPLTQEKPQDIGKATGIINQSPAMPAKAPVKVDAKPREKSDTSKPQNKPKVKANAPKKEPQSDEPIKIPTDPFTMPLASAFPVGRNPCRDGPRGGKCEGGKPKSCAEKEVAATPSPCAGEETELQEDLWNEEEDEDLDPKKQKEKPMKASKPEVKPSKDAVLDPKKQKEKPMKASKPEVKPSKEAVPPVKKDDPPKAASKPQVKPSKEDVPAVKKETPPKASSKPQVKPSKEAAPAKKQKAKKKGSSKKASPPTKPTKWEQPPLPTDSFSFPLLEAFPLGRNPCRDGPRGGVEDECDVEPECEPVCEEPKEHKKEPKELKEEPKELKDECPEPPKKKKCMGWKEESKEEECLDEKPPCASKKPKVKDEKKEKPPSKPKPKPKAAEKKECKRCKEPESEDCSVAFPRPPVPAGTTGLQRSDSSKNKPSRKAVEAKSKSPKEEALEISKSLKEEALEVSQKEVAKAKSKSPKEEALEISKSLKEEALEVSQKEVAKAKSKSPKEEALEISKSLKEEALEVSQKEVAKAMNKPPPVQSQEESKPPKKRPPRRPTSTEDSQGSPELKQFPVAPLQASLRAYLASIQPLLTAKEFKEEKKLTEEFEDNEGQELHELLEAAADKCTNWLTPRWTQAAYLAYQAPVTVFSSPGLSFPVQKFATPKECLTFTAKAIHATYEFKELVDQKKIPIVRMGNTDLDNSQFGKIFGTVRRPGRCGDTLKQHNKAQYVVVVYKYNFFKLPLFSSSGNLLSVTSIRDELEAIVNCPLERGEPFGLLTHDNRGNWAEAYLALNCPRGNADSVEAIEQSLFVVCLDDCVPVPKGQESIVQAYQLLHGGGLLLNSANRWMDKTIQLIVNPNGLAGFCYEHAPADCQPLAMLMDYILEKVNDKNSDSEKSNEDENQNPATLLKFQPSDDCINMWLHVAMRNVNRITSMLRMNVFRYECHGKTFIKAQGLNPDSYIQMALQLAYYNMHGYIPAQYESAHLRIFLEGRTETIRSTSNESKAFVLAMNSEEASCTEQLAALHSAVDAHDRLTKLALQGKGIDRYLFGLQQMALENCLPVPKFFKSKGFVRSVTFQLFTSQVATMHDSFMAYGPLICDGYGCCYNPHNDKIIFALSAWQTSPKISPKQYGKAIKMALDTMRKLILETGGDRVGEHPCHCKNIQT